MKGLLLVCLLPSLIRANENSDQKEFCLTPSPIVEADVVKPYPAIENDRDFDAIHERGTLRVLLQKKNITCAISHTEQQLIQEFAHINDLKLHWVYVENDWQLLPELIKGKGDIIVAQDLSLSASIKNEVEFSHSWGDATYKIVERANNSRIRRFSDLSGRKVAVYESSPAWNKLVKLQDSISGIAIEKIPETLSYEEVMQRVKIGEYDLTVADSLFLESYLPLNTALSADFNLTEKRKMAWAVRTSNKVLYKTLNQYLNQQYLTHDVASIYFEDFPDIKDRGILRVITNTNPSHYYLHNGKLRGFEYELLNTFAKKHRLRLDVVLADSHEDMFALLQAGKGDVIAASLPNTLLREKDTVKYSMPYHYASPVIVGREQDNVLADIRDLLGRRITLAADSPYWNYLLQLKEQGVDFELVKADSGVNMEGVLLMVGLGMYDLTVVGNHQVNSYITNDTGLKPQIILSEPLAHRWAVRAEDKLLTYALDEFIQAEFRSENYNVLHAKYFEQAKLFNNNRRVTTFNAISPYDALTQEYSAEYGFDWRLITALMYQESQFNPQAFSYAGAEGLMQLIPATAELMGVSDTHNPDNSIDAGIRYLNYLRGKFEEALQLEDRMWFTLASYNAGYGRVKRARILAEEMGLDKNKWFDNVELAMMGSTKTYFKNGEEFKYCSCSQTVVYVREIRTRYFNYIRLVDTQKFANLSPIPSRLNYVKSIN